MTRKRIFISIVGCLIVWAIGFGYFVSPAYGQSKADSDMRIVKTKQGYEFYEGSQKIMAYQQQYKSLQGKYRRCNYIHPLYGPDGEVLPFTFFPVSLMIRLVTAQPLEGEFSGDGSVSNVMPWIACVR